MKHILLALVLAACGGSKQPDPAKATPAASATVIELAELTLIDGDQPFMKLHADGKSEIAFAPGKWDPGPTFHADGTIDFEGKPMGKVTTGIGGQLELVGTHNDKVVATDAMLTVTQDGEVSGLELGADGKATFTGAHHRKGQSFRIEGATTPGKRQTALLMSLLMFGKAKVVSDPPTQGP